MSSFKNNIDLILDGIFKKDLLNQLFLTKKQRKNLKSSSQIIKFNIPIVKLLDHYLKDQFLIEFEDLLKIFGNIHLRYLKNIKYLLTKNLQMIFNLV